MTTLGLRENRRQIALLLAVNAFVGSMVGLERSVLPLLAERTFGLASTTAALSFIVAFGISKAFANLAAGRLAERVGRRRLLVGGWLFALPVPALVIWAPSWGWVIAANLFLGVNQGLCWSMTVIMKMDLAGAPRRGLVMGLNESAGYGGVAIAAFASAALAHAHGPRPAPILLGFGIAAAGLVLSVAWARDTAPHAAVPDDGPPRRGSLTVATQAGAVNNLNDAMAWGLLPIFLASQGMTLDRIGLIAGAYPLAWATLQPLAGALSDRRGRKDMIAAGMFLQAAAIAWLATAPAFAGALAAALAMGAGTAMAYPTLLAAVGDLAGHARRAHAIGTYRLWRDLGFAIGGAGVGVSADLVGPRAAILAVAVVTALSGALVAARLEVA